MLLSVIKSYSMEPADYKLITSEVNQNYLVPEEDKEDFVQDILVKLLEKRPKYVSKPYIRQLIRNMLIDKHRKLIRRPTIIYTNKNYGNDGGKPEDY